MDKVSSQVTSKLQVERMILGRGFVLEQLYLEALKKFPEADMVEVSVFKRTNDIVDEIMEAVEEFSGVYAYDSLRAKVGQIVSRGQK
jgi:hypothetical protein